MKQLFFFLVIIALSSCRKDFTCTCTAEDESFNRSQTLSMTENAAEDWCSDWDNDNMIDEEEIEEWNCTLSEN